MMKRRSMEQRTRRFARDESGAVTVEALLWIPFFFGMLLMIVDASAMFYGKTITLRAVQDANRAFSTGSIATEEEVQNHVKSRLASLSQSVSALTEVNGVFVTTTVKIPIEDLLVSGVFKALAKKKLVIEADYFLEQ